MDSIQKIKDTIDFLVEVSNEFNNLQKMGVKGAESLAL
jgi:hypothetical protein